MSNLTDVFSDDPTMRKRDEFEHGLMRLLADLRMTQPPARRSQLRADCEELLKKWFDLTGQEVTKAEVEELIRTRNETRQWKPEKWTPQGTAPG